MIHQTLHDGWQLTAVSGDVPATVAGRSVRAEVPGSTHLDLLAAGLIADPYLDRVEADLVWTHRADWRYAVSFDADAPGADERVDLVFDGLDTVATVELNGQVLGTTKNMHRGYRFDVRGLLRGGANELVVSFRSALAYAEEVEAELGRREHAYPHPFNMIRKMACSFGWDWGPDLQTAGIWKPVRLERWRAARLASTRPLVTVDADGTGRVEVHVDVERAGTAVLELVAAVDGRETRVPIDGDTGVATALVPDADLWWPVGYGAQPRYDLSVALLADGEVVDTSEHRIGFRTITVDTAPDEIGTPFTFVVNGKPVFAKGANWIPDDHFLTRITRDRLARRVDQAVGANMNLLRIWGGGIYETDDFYDVCDERGVLVWQDFPFACGSYAEEEPLRSEVEAEARENVARLVAHPSLALWNGNNENLWGFADWGWPEQLEGRTWGLGYYTELLPSIVAELDPTRHYSPGSPYSPGDVHPNDPDHGTRHEWEVWNRIDYAHYLDHVPRFCSEFGFQGPPTWTTLTDWVHDEPLTPTSPGFLGHQKAEDGNGKLDRGLAAHLPVPEDFADWHWATQLNQARAVSFGIEHFRSWWPRTAGSVVWQLNDCWPATSWAAIDGDERPKPLWYALKHAYAGRLLTVQPRDGRPVLVVVNDEDDDWSGELVLERQSFTGAVLAASRIEFAVRGRSTALLDLADPLVTATDPEAEVLVATTGDVRAVHLFAEDRDLSYDPAPLSAGVEAVPGGYRVDVRAASFARDVAVLADRVAPDAVVEEMLVPMLAGESRSFLVRTEAVLDDPSALAGPLVLRCANALAPSAVGS
ncbi:glycosyl hydrolase 2 galactose-binding domain-containing protein [Umezawaea sp. Da 62-37]|uniref:glycoside hydrolase family 2 protein n=1 Tax=Umezawaea sp. Da 62-37 TaxID=3075927 RepID=UPI0028F71EEA|nr:glycoside hydrolase family 2 protein [Umezawaea sp. Da 62-37]WNV88159.1 glycoside hydrolase family 2 protein [Umezawaea sp. Da 62-37]